MKVDRTALPAPIVIPSRDDIERGLSAVKPMPERVAFVNKLLEPARLAANAIDNLYKEIDRRDELIAQQKTELSTLRQKLGGLDDGGRAAAEARYDMLGKINAARGIAQAARRDIDEAFKRLEDALKKDK